MPPHPDLETYTILGAGEVIYHGPCIGTVTDALTGRVTATYRDGISIQIGEPLCSGCDAPVADGPCGCMIQADPAISALSPSSERKAA